jgi:hypothetical protein
MVTSNSVVIGFLCPPYEVALTNSMEQKPSWEGSIFSASQEISCILCYPKFHYRFHKQTTLVPNLKEMHPAMQLQRQSISLSTQVVHCEMSCVSGQATKTSFSHSSFSDTCCYEVFLLHVL